MSFLRTPPAGHQPPPGTVEVAHRASGLAVVSVSGEHDLSTAPELAQALAHAAAHSDVLVDLSECSFIDSSVIKALIKSAHELRASGDQFAVVIPPEQSQVARIAQMTHLDDLFPIHTALGAALASLEASTRPASPESVS